jgi:hypothetical protein
MDATSMSLYWVARLPIKRPKGRTSVFAETGVPVYDADADVENAIRDAIEAAFPGTTANGKVRISSKTSPAARHLRRGHANMSMLRYVLMALTTAALGFFAYAIAKYASDRVLSYSFVIGLILNLVYLYFSHPAAAGKQSRLARLVSLWLDAKERELRDRAERLSNLD